MAQALAQLANYESASEELAGICEQLERLQSVELPSLEERRKRLLEGAEAADRLDAAIRLAQGKLEPVLLKHRAAKETLQLLDGLRREIGEREQRQAQLEAKAASAQPGNRSWRRPRRSLSGAWKP